uniref:Non-specific serine/threonine protein kinase n=1 Tax=Macrostomum lignano TaxID=282301 RepID=A0A1I8FVV1_9PLAT
MSSTPISNIFWQLSSASNEEREKAAQFLALAALNKDNKHLTFDTIFKDKEEQKSKNMEVEAKEMLPYCLERLFKGLAGQKAESKLGFSLALTLEASSKRIGVCLLLLAAIRGAAFAKLRPEQRTRMLDAVVPLLSDRGYADFGACALAGAIEQLPPDEFSSNLFKKLSDKLTSGWDALDANGLLLLLCCHQHQKDSVSRAYIKSHYATKHLISQANFEHFKRICLSTADESHETLSGCRLHPGIERLLDSLLAKSQSLLSEFASTVAIATVANVESSASRKALSLAMLSWIADCPAERFESKPDCLTDCLASDEVCRQLRSHASSRKSLLHSFACRLLSKQLLPGSPSDESVLIAVAKRLLGCDCLFDDGLPVECRVLRADTMARLPVEVLDSCASQIEAELGSIDFSKQQPEDSAGSRRRRIAFGLQTLRQLVAGSRTLLAGKSKSCSRILLRLADLFLLPSNNAVSLSVATDARSAFCRALDSMSSAALSGGGAYRRGYRRCLRYLAQGLIDRLSTISSKKSAVHRALSLGLELLQVTSASAAGDDEAEGAAGSCGGIDWCFAIACLHLGFHLLPGGADVATGRLLRSVASLVARQVAALVTPEGVASLTQLLLEGDDESEANGEGDNDAQSEESGSQQDEAEDEEDGDSEQESEISFGEASDSDTNAVDPDFRRACKSALGDAACPSDAEADVDPSDLSDSAMERVDQVLSLAFRSQLGPGRRRGDRAAVLERRRRRCQAKLRLLDLAEPLLLAGGVRCRLSLAACLTRLALLAAGGGGGGGFWSAAPAGEREQLRQRSLNLLKRAATSEQQQKTCSGEGAAADSAVEDELAKAVETALAANLKSPLPAKLAETAAAALSALLRIRPGSVESRLSDALSHQLSPPAQQQQQQQRFRLGGLALWQRVCSERPGLLSGLRSRLLDLLLDPQLKSHDLASVISLAVCLVKNSLKTESHDADFNARLSEWTFERLSTETGPNGVTSAHLLAALLQLAAALLRQSRLSHQPKQQAGIPTAATRVQLADQLRQIRSGTKSLDLRRGLQACQAELAATASNSRNKKKKRASETEASATVEENSKKRRRVAAKSEDQPMETE